jgi:hypothetical protein
MEHPCRNAEEYWRPPEPTERDMGNHAIVHGQVSFRTQTNVCVVVLYCKSSNFLFSDNFGYRSRGDLW